MWGLIGVLTFDLLGSLSTRTFERDAAAVERLRLERGLLRMTAPGLADVELTGAT